MPLPLVYKTSAIVPSNIHHLFSLAFYQDAFYTVFLLLTLLPSYVLSSIRY
jgi:hypothetical protein